MDIVREKKWWVKQDLNLQQRRYERRALTIELLTHLTLEVGT